MHKAAFVNLIKSGEGINLRFFECVACKNMAFLPFADTPKYCPNCGGEFLEMTDLKDGKKYFWKPDPEDLPDP